jgi:hypothetical protein
MPSLSDLPNEVLSRIEPDVKSLLVLAQVNRHFYQVYIPKVYETFVDDQPHKGAGKEETGTDFARGRLIQFFQTVFSSSELAAMTKNLNLMGWIDWKHSSHRNTHQTQCALRRHHRRYKTSGFADLMLTKISKPGITLCAAWADG